MSHNIAMPPSPSVQLYRDCLRLIRHSAGSDSPKSARLRAVVRAEFRRNAKVEQPAELERLRGNAVRALTNYMLLLQTAGRGGPAGGGAGGA